MSKPREGTKNGFCACCNLAWAECFCPTHTGGCKSQWKMKEPGLSKATKDEITQARDLYQTNDLEIGPTAQVCRTKSGHWISAWIWIPWGVEAAKAAKSKEEPA